MNISNDVGIEAWIGPFAETVAEERTDDISVQFQYPFLNTDFDLNSPTLVGDGAASVSGGNLKVSSTTGSAYIESKSAVRYRPGHSGFARFTARFVGTGTGQIGPCDKQDGFFIQVSNGNISLGYRNGGSDTLVTPFATTNKFQPGGLIDVTEIDFTKMNIFAVDFGYLGVATPVFWIKLGVWRVLGVIETENMLTAPHIGNPVLPISVSASGDMAITTASWNGGIIGKDTAIGGRYFPYDMSGTLSNTAVLTLGTFHNKTSYQGIANKVQSKIIRYSFFADAPSSGSGTVEFKLYKNATLDGTANYTDIDADNSVLEFDSSATYSSGGRVLLTEWVGYAAGSGANAKTGGEKVLLSGELGLFLYPNETATLTAQNVGLGNEAATCRAEFNWLDLF